MDDLSIVVFSSDQNEDLWPIFHYYLNKYWPNHPRTYLLTETKHSFDFITIGINTPVERWSARVREALKIIPDEKVIFISDDCFLNAEVNISKLLKCINILNDENIANINFKLSIDDTDINSNYPGFKIKQNNSNNRLSFLCGIWNRHALIDILSLKDATPWDLEAMQDMKNYTSYIVSDEKVLSWFNDNPMASGACVRGKWVREIDNFLKQDGIEVDYSKKGFYENS